MYLQNCHKAPTPPPNDMRFKALAVRFSVPLPPPSGPVRTDFCLHSGLEAIDQALRLKGDAERKLSPLLAGGWAAAPPMAWSSRGWVRAIGARPRTHASRPLVQIAATH